MSQIEALKEQFHELIGEINDERVLLQLYNDVITILRLVDTRREQNE